MQVCMQGGIKLAGNRGLTQEPTPMAKSELKTSEGGAIIYIMKYPLSITPYHSFGSPVQVRIEVPWQ